MDSSRKAMYSGPLNCLGSSKGLILHKHVTTKLIEIFYFKNRIFMDIHFKIFQQSRLPDWNELTMILVVFLNLTTDVNYQNYFLTAVHSSLSLALGSWALRNERRSVVSVSGWLTTAGLSICSNGDTRLPCSTTHRLLCPWRTSCWQLSQTLPWYHSQLYDRR